MKKYLKYVIMNKIQELISSYELNRAMATVDILFDELNPLGRSVCLFSAYVSSARMYFISRLMVMEGEGMLSHGE